MPLSMRAQYRLTYTLVGFSCVIGLVVAATAPLATGTDPVVVAAGLLLTVVVTGLTLLPAPTRNWAGQLLLLLVAVGGLVVGQLVPDLPRVGDPGALWFGQLVFAGMGLAIGDLVLTATGRPSLPPPGVLPALVGVEARRARPR